MGGVTLELLGLARAEGVYAELLATTHVDPLVDVISGTSAGGLNGAFLGAALVHSTDLMPLRDLWIETGSFAKLLRDPLREPSPPLASEGRRLLSARAAESVRSTGDRGTPRAYGRATDRTLTATQLVGRKDSLADDFGTVIEDVDHKTRFRFRRGPGVEIDSFAHRRIGDQLSLAARSSASFPGAFEACWIPMDDETEREETGDPRGRPGHDEGARLRGGRRGPRQQAGRGRDRWRPSPTGGSAIPEGVAVHRSRPRRGGDPRRRGVADPFIGRVVQPRVDPPHGERGTAFREARDANRRAEEAIVARCRSRPRRARGRSKSSLSRSSTRTSPCVEIVRFGTSSIISRKGSPR